MEISVKVTSILPAQSGISKKSGEKWVKNTFVGTTAGQYPKTVCFSVLGEDKFREMNIQVGGSYNVSFDVESREYNGRYYTDLQAWKVLSLDASGGQQQGNNHPASDYGKNQQMAAPAPQSGGRNPLPF